MTLLVSSVLPANSHLVRLHPAEGVPYDRMIVVVDEGDTLFLMGWIGEPLTLSEWRQAKAELFPEAKHVRFERRKGQQARTVTLKIN